MPASITNRMSKIERGRSVVLRLREERVALSVALGESVMSRFRFSPGIRASQLTERYAGDPREPCLTVAPTPDPLPRRLQIALLTLRNSDHATQILKVLYGNGERRADRGDYAALAPLGFALRDKHGFHSITPRGQYRAGLLVHELAAELGVRLVNYRSLLRSGKRQRLYGMSDAGNA